MKIFGYIRTNSGEIECNEEYGFGNSYSYETQKEMILEYLNKKYTVSKTGKTYKITKPNNVDLNWYADRNESVNQLFEKRRSLKMILTKMKRGDLIVVSHFNRLFVEKVHECLDLLNRVKDASVNIVICEFGESITGNNKSSKVVLSLIDGLDRMRKIKGREKIRRVKKEEKIKKNYLGGRLPFGKTIKINESGDKVIIEQIEEQKIIKYMKHLWTKPPKGKQLSLNEIRKRVFKKFDGTSYKKPTSSTYSEKYKLYEINENSKENNSYLTTQTILNIKKQFEENKIQKSTVKLKDSQPDKVKFGMWQKSDIPFGKLRVGGILVDSPIQKKIIERVVKHRKQKNQKGQPLSFRIIQDKIEEEFKDERYADGSKITLSHTAIRKIVRGLNMD